MMSLNLKTKIFFPLFVLLFGIGLYFYWVWLPKSIDFAKRESIALLHHSLEIVEDQITQDLVQGNMTRVSQNLDLMLLKNPSWHKLVLRDIHGKTLYPEGHDAPDIDQPDGSMEVKSSFGVSDILLPISLEMNAYGQKIGTLDLQYDFSESENMIRQHGNNLFFLLLGLLSIFTGVAIFIIQYFVISPALLLTRAADEFTKNGSDASLSTLKLPHITRDEMGRLTSRFAAMCRSILKQQQDLQQQNEDLVTAKNIADRANQAKTDFLANMSHELRTPLNSIIGLTRMFTEDSELSEENQKMAHTVNIAANSLLDIVNDILDISKIESGNVILEQIAFDLTDVVANVMETLSPIASAKGIALSFEYATRDDLYIVGDPLRIGRIITNLVSNAIKYTETGHVTLSMGTHKGMDAATEADSIIYDNTGKVDVQVNLRPLPDHMIEVYCVVKDTGIGIPKEKQKMIFEKFTQADVSTTRKFGGTGLGLAITKDLVQMMGGAIGVESELGKGSTFWFKIPFKMAAQADFELQDNRMYRKKSKAPSHDLIPAGQVRVLVAEDHMMNQLLMKKLLARLGIPNFEIANNGVEAVDQWKSGAFDLILMDCHMPEKNGYDATKDIRVEEKRMGKNRMPVIAVTADAMTGTREKCIAAGMDEYVTKPINIDELKHVMGEWISFQERT